MDTPSNKELKNAKTRYKPRVISTSQKVVPYCASQVVKYFCPSVQVGDLLGEGVPHIQKASTTHSQPTLLSYPDNHMIK